MEHKNLSRVVGIAGFMILSTMVLLLYIFTIYHAWVLHSLGEIVVILLIMGIAYEILRQGKNLKDISLGEHNIKDNLINFGCVLVGALITYTLKVNLQLGAVLAASLVALIAAMVVPHRGVPIYCGAFVGMTSSRLLVNHAELAFAAIIAGILFVVTDRAFKGFGGKLGTIAFTGTFITGLGLRKEFIMTSVPEWDLIGSIVLFSTLATVVTFWLNIKRKLGGVAASGIVGITGGLVMPALYPGDMGNTLAVMVICASFAGMSEAQRFPKIFPMIGVGIVTGVVFIYSTPLAGGAGGKLSAIAFGATIAVRGYMDLFERIKTKRLNVEQENLKA